MEGNGERRGVGTAERTHEYRERNGIKAGVRDEWLPFTRLDLYGPTGEGPWPWFEYVRLAVFGVVLLFRLIAFVFLVAVFFAICHLHTRIRLPWARRLLERVDMTIAHTSLPVAFGVLPRVFRVSGPPVGAVEDFRHEDGRLMKPPLVVPNHCGWIDIVVTSSLFFPSFVARAGTEKLPLAGIAAVVFQFILVEREKAKDAIAGASAARAQEGNGTAVAGGRQQAQPPSGSASETVGGAPGAENASGSTQPFSAAAKQVYDRLRDLAERDQRGEMTRPLVVFPEGTTTNGRFLLHFRIGAFRAGLPVQPVLLSYTPVTASISWDTITFVRHFFLCLSAPATLCRVFLLPPYYPSQQERADPALFAANVHAYMVSFSKSLPGMRTHGGLVPSGGSLKDKRDFHQALLKEREREGEEAKKVA